MSETSLDEMLRMRKELAAEKLAASKDATSTSQAKKAMKTKGMVSKAGTLAGTVIGAIYGQPQLGATIGGVVGGQAGGMLADNKIKSAEAKKKYNELGGEEEDPIQGLIGSLSKYGGMLGGSDGADTDILKERL